MAVVLDTNVLVAALIHGGIVNRIILSNPGVWAVADHCLGELWRHRQVWNRAGLSEDRLVETIEALSGSYLSVYSEQVYEGKLEEATPLVLDPEDAPVVALALSIENEGVWTFNRADFDPAMMQGRIELLSTTRVESMYPPSQSDL